MTTQQQEYQARPVYAYVNTRSFSGGFRFHTFEEAMAWIVDQRALALRDDPESLTPFHAEIDCRK